MESLGKDLSESSSNLQGCMQERGKLEFFSIFFFSERSFKNIIVV